MEKHIVNSTSEQQHAGRATAETPDDLCEHIYRITGTGRAATQNGPNPADDEGWLARRGERPEPTLENQKPQRSQSSHRWCRDKITRDRSTFIRPSVRRALLKTEPDCRTCGALATEIDHIKPICFGGRHDASNWAPICRRCHLRKTSQEAHRVRWHGR